MSLSDETPNKLLSNDSYTNSYVKVVYNKISYSSDSDYDLTNLSGVRFSLEERITNAITANPRVEFLFTNEYNQLYKNPDFTEQIKFIFLGKQNDQVNTELAKIVDNIRSKHAEGPYNDVNMELLLKELMFNDEDKLKTDFDLTNATSVFFPDIFISKTLNINTLHKIVANTLSEHDEGIFTPESIYMYGEKQQQIIDFEYETLKRQILLRQLENPLNFSVNNIERTLKSYIVPDLLIKHILKDYTNTQLFLYKVFEDSSVKEYIKLYLRFNNITFNYRNKDGFNYPTDSRFDYYFSEKIAGTSTYKSELTPKNVVYSDLKKTSTVNDLFIENTCIYLYNFYNIEDVIRQSITTVTANYKKNLYKTFTIKYFPDLKQSDLFLTTENKAEIKKTAQDNKDIIYNFSNINRTFNTFKNSGTDEIVSVKEDKPYLIIIKKNINIPSNFDFTYLFNELKLDENIPFVKFRDSNGIRDIIYKVFKPIIKKGSFNEHPKLSKDVLDTWIKFKGYEVVNYDLKNVRANPKNISFRHKFSTIKDKVEISGEIVMINNDGSVDIISDKGDLYTELSRDNIKSTGSSIAIGSKVLFFKNNMIFAEIDLYKKKYLEFVLDLRDFTEFDTSIMKNIDLNIQSFMDRIFSTDSLARFKDINIGNNLGYNFKITDNHISNMIYKYNLELKTPLRLDYESFDKAAKILYPFVTIDEDLYQLDTVVEYFYKDTADSPGEWLKSIIKKINVDFTYNLQFSNPKKDMVIIHKENIDKILLRSFDNNASKVFKIMYKQVSGFNDMSSIDNYLSKLNNIGLDCLSQIKRVVETFLLERDSAVKLVKDYVKDTVFSDISRGIGLTFMYSKALYSESGPNNIEVFVDNVNSESQVNELYFFIKFIINIALVIKDRSKSPSESIFGEILSEDVILKDGSITVNKLDTALKITPTKSSVGNILTDVNEYDDYSDLDDDSDDDSDDSDDSDEDIASEIEESMLVMNNSDKEVFDEEKQLSKELHIDSIMNNSSLLKRIQLADKDLVDSVYKDADSSKAQGLSYGRQCQQANQPLVMNNRDKEVFDQEFSEHSYSWESNGENPISPYSADERGNKKNPGGIYEYIDCDSETIKTLNPLTQQCKSIKTGSTVDTTLHNWYMCPKIYDAYNNKPIHFRDIKFDGHPEDTSETFNPSVNNWMVHSSDNQFNGIKITEFRPYYQKNDGARKQYVKEKGKVSTGHNLVFRKERYTPGFLNSSSDFLVPCCAKNSDSVKKQWIGDVSQAAESTYIKKWGSSLSKGANGLMKDIMEPFFKNFSPPTPGRPNAIFGDIKNSYDHFIRYGVDTDHNNIFHIFSKLHNIPPGNLIENILTKVTPTTFNNLNNRNMLNQFNFTGVQSPFQNFMEYTISNQHKNLEFYIELLSLKKHKVVERDIAIITLEIDLKTNTINVICPNYYDNNFEYNEQVAFILKTPGGFYEPLCVYKAGAASFLFDKTELLQKYRNLKQIFKVLKSDGNCSIKTPSQLYEDNNIFKFKRGADISTLLGIIRKELHKEYTVEDIVLDDDNKAVGILMNDNITIPVYPESFNNLAYPTKQNINLVAVDLTKLEEAFKSINSHLSEDNQISIIDNYNKDDTHTILTNTGNYIQVSAKPDLKDYTKSSIKTDYHKIDNDLFSHRRTINKAHYKPALEIKYVKAAIDKLENYTITKIISRNEGSEYADGLVITNPNKHELFIPIQNIKKSAIELLFTTDKLISTYDFKISIALSSYMDSIIQFSKATFYEVSCIPIRGLFSDNLNSKRYTGLILETGKIISIKDTHQFNISDKDTNGNYILNELIDYQLVDKLFSNVKITINDELLNTRIRSNLRVNYQNSIITIIKNKIYEMFQNIKFLKVKEFIENIIKNPIIKNSYKKILIKPIFRLIISSIVTYSDTVDINNFTKLVNNKICSQNLCDSEYCLNTPYTISEKFDDEFGDDLIIKRGLVDLDKEDFSDLTEETLRKFKENIIKIDNNILDELVDIHRETLTILSELSSVCKLKILHQNPSDLLVFNKIKGKIFNDLIFNKYTNYELFNFNNTGSSSGELQYDEESEIIFNGADYSTSLLNKLYIYKLNNYYNTIIPFEKTIQRISVIKLDKLIDPLENVCVINLDETKSYKINDKLCGIKPKRNKNKYMTNNLHVMLSNKQKTELEKLLSLQ